MPLPEILARIWGYSEFRPLQREAMQAILDGRDSVVVLPTGGGKSLCFQAPALVGDDGLALIISPLISLMKDQVDTLVSNGVPAALFNSSLSADEKDTVVAGLREARYRLLYVAPERLVGEGGESFLRLLSRSRVRFVAVDEAHCISQWGHDFRPEYRQLVRLRERWPDVSVHAFTATATGRVRQDIVSQLGLRDPLELIGSFDRPNLLYRVIARSNLKQQIQQVLGRHEHEAGIIYCQSRREVDQLATWLQTQQVRALPYHAGLADDMRHRHQDAFLNEEADVIVATVAFGMGIDRSDVRFVLHAGAPQSLEHYQQESGRAGRDGLFAECVLVYSAGDFVRWRMMFEKSGELTDARRALLRDIEGYAAGVGCRHRRLVGYFGEAYTRDDCGACDYCLGELEAMEDSVTIARKVLSAVARVGQRFGVAHVTNVLRGSDTELVRTRGHRDLSVFGLFQGASVDEVRGYVEQLIARGLLRQTDDAYPVLQLSAEGLEGMKDEASLDGLVLARQRKPQRAAARKARSEVESWEGVDRGLFEHLRGVRLSLARERGVPPYVIFHDATLRDLARVRPASVGALEAIYGLGAKKIEDLGEVIVEAIRSHLNQEAQA